MQTSPNPSRNPSGNPSRNPYSERQTNPHSEPRATPTPAPSPSPQAGLDLGTSLRAANGLQATTIALLILRPDWPEADTTAALARDPRPWRTVVAAAFACALDPAIEHPSRIETTNPARVVADHGPTPTPPSYAEVRRRQAALEDAS